MCIRDRFYVLGIIILISILAPLAFFALVVSRRKTRRIMPLQTGRESTVIISGGDIEPPKR